MYIPNTEVERVAASLIAEYGVSATDETRVRVAWANARGLGPTALAWAHVLECIEHRLNDDREAEFRVAC